MEGPQAGKVNTLIYIWGHTKGLASPQLVVGGCFCVWMGKWASLAARHKDWKDREQRGREFRCGAAVMDHFRENVKGTGGPAGWVVAAGGDVGASEFPS